MTSPSIVFLRTQTDERLVALARQGHERAFEAIVERYRKPLLRACRRVLPEARAEDALQHALVSAWRGLQRGDEVRDLRAWLYRIAHNTSLNQLRISGYDFDELRESLRIADATDDELERRAIVRQTLTGLAALPARQRDALLAIAVEGRSQDEVAHELGLSEGAVRQLVHRARTTLRAAATAITPLPLASWAAAAATRGVPLTERIGELTAGAGGAGAASVLAKAGAVVVLAGGAAGAPAVIDRAHDDRAHNAAKAGAVHAPSTSDDSGQDVVEALSSAPARLTGRGRGRRHGVSGGLGRRGSGRGRSGSDDSSRHRSGRRRSGGSDDRVRELERGDDSSGSGPGPSGGGGTSGGDDRTGSSGSGTSGSGTSGSGTSSDDGHSGSGSSGSGSSGSGSSGSAGGELDSSGPGSGEVVTPTEQPRTDSSGPGSGGSSDLIDSSGSSGSSGHSGSGRD
jgi:RNA polymerase sigma factor (sigma-70 family)